MQKHCHEAFPFIFSYNELCEIRLVIFTASPREDRLLKQSTRLTARLSYPTFTFSAHATMTQYQIKHFQTRYVFVDLRM